MTCNCGDCDECYLTKEEIDAIRENSTNPHEAIFRVNSLNNLLKRELGELYGQIVTTGERYERAGQGS